ncbi:MAG TPA: family 20 glycosylhydrolase [Rhodanobacteraceae bacterium]
MRIFDKAWRHVLGGVAIIVMVCGGVAHATTMRAAETPLPVIPLPAQVTRLPGAFRATSNTVISASHRDAKAQWVAHYLAGLLWRTRGLRLSVRSDAGPADTIRLVLDPHVPVTQPEGYSLDVDPRGIAVRARTEAGLFYGAVTVWQLLTPGTGHGPVDVPCVAIRDWPRFRWRGFMLDSARHMQSVAEIKRLINQMALHKLDVFHWHLTDDQGWRLQVKAYPKLTRMGAWRKPPGAGTHGEPGRYGGFYTERQIRAIVAYAARRHITVVPEIDMPGHAQAAVASYPDVLGSTSGHPSVAVQWGINPYLFSVRPQSLAMVRHILGAVLRLFPSPYIHIGGDEAIKNQWRASPVAQAKMRVLGLKSEDALQAWFVDQLGSYLAAHGRRLVGWDEILEGAHLPANAIVESWHGATGAIKAARLGHDAVLAPYGALYLAHLQSDRTNEPSGVFPVVSLAKVYAFNPVPASLTAAQTKHVLGTEAALWTEYVSSSWEVEHAVFPRLDAFAELAWTPQTDRHFDGFLQRLPAQIVRYRKLDIAAADSAFAVDIRLPDGRSAALATGRVHVSLGNQADFGHIHYTIDGSVPTLHSPSYVSPFSVALPATIRAAAFSTQGIELARPSDRVLDRAVLLTRTSAELEPCAGQHIGDRVPLLPDLGKRNTPQYDVDVFASCWIYPHARLDGVDGIVVKAAELARNRHLLKQGKALVQHYPQTSPQGDLEVRLDDCKGSLIAAMPLPIGGTLGDRFTLTHAIKVPAGTHDLCLRFAAPVNGPMYAIGSVQLHERVGNAASGLHESSR